MFHRLRDLSPERGLRIVMLAGDCHAETILQILRADKQERVLRALMAFFALA